MNVIFAIAYAAWLSVIEAAPWLIFGFIIAGIIHSFLPLSWINLVLKKPGFTSIFRASLLGAPLPLCSCSIIPVVRSLREKGVPKGATASFMTSTPEIGIGSFLLTHGLLGPVFAILRVVASIVSAILVGLLVDSIKETDQEDATVVNANSLACNNLKLTDTKACCANNGEQEKELLMHKVKSTLYFSFYTLPKDLLWVLIFGFLIAGAFSVYLPSEFLTETVSSPYIQIGLALLISLPMYVCATSSTPIAAVLLYKGLSAGAVLVFLLAGAATNVSTILAARKEFGLRGAVYYVTSIILVSVLFGIGFEYFLPRELFVDVSSPMSLQEHAHNHTSSSVVWGVLFCLIMLFALLF